ncbi:hypothetical protein [Pseudomonas aeruginosa]
MDFPLTKEALQALSLSAHNNKTIVLDGSFNFTKDRNIRLQGKLLRLKSVESNCSEWVIQRLAFDTLRIRLLELDTNLKNLEWPRHYPVKILEGNDNLRHQENVFLYFPYGAGIKSTQEQDIFGFEFTQVTTDIFTKIHRRCLEKVASRELLELYERLFSHNLIDITYLYSLLHEMAHRVGAWKVIPQKAQGMGAGGINLSIIGELWADLQLLHVSKEFPELTLFIFLNRIFWYTRKGFEQNPEQASINIDNDSWGGAYLWTKLVQTGAVSLAHGELNVEFALMQDTFEECRLELQELALSCISAPLHAEQYLNLWREKILGGELGYQSLPPDLQILYVRCLSVPETLAYRSGCEHMPAPGSVHTESP